MKKIVVAGGCFWGVEEYYRRVKGVEQTRVGYAQGIKENPTYQEVRSGMTQHVEAVELIYDEQVISLHKIMELLMRIIDPTSLNKQGEDEGTQYRTGIYTNNAEETEQARSYIASQQAFYSEPIQVEVEQLSCFYDAEEYHQKYLIKNPTGYCHVNFSKLQPEDLK